MSSNASKKRRRNALLQRLYDEAGGICFYCEKQIPLALATKDHQHPIARGGAKGANNCVLACHVCNSMKSYFTAEEWTSILEQFPDVKKLRDATYERLFNNLNTESAEIGRAHV